MQHTIVLIWVSVIGACFGSFALAVAWRIHKGKDFVHERSECEHCHHALGATDLVPLVSWLVSGGRCRYCRTKLSSLFPLAELTGLALFTASFMWWPDGLQGVLPQIRIAVWACALVLLLILLFYDLQWYLLPNKIMYPLWAVAVLDAGLRFLQAPSAKAFVLLVAAMVVGAGVFYALFTISQGKWIGFGDVRLGVAIALLLGTPQLAGLTIFISSVIGLVAVVPSLVQKKSNFKTKIPYGPFLILALIVVRLRGEQLVQWYISHVLLLS